MKKTWVKGICTVLCILCLSAGFCCLGVVLLQWDVDFSDSIGCRALMAEDRDAAAALERYRLSNAGDADQQIPQELAQNVQQLDPANTNFRYILRAPDWTIVGSNIPDGEEGSPLHRIDEAFTLEQYDVDGYLLQFDLYFFEYGVADPLKVQDAYSDALVQYEELQDALPGLLCSAIGSLLAGSVLLILLLRAAGWRSGQPNVILNVQDQIPYDLYLAAAVFAGAVFIGAWSNAYFNYRFCGNPAELVVCGAAILGVAAVAVAALLTTAARVKTGTIFRNTVIWRICRLAARAFRTLPMTWRAGGLFFLYLLGTSVTLTTPFLIPLYQGFVLWLVCRWVLQWRQIRQATEAIVAGRTDMKIDSRKFFPDLYQHAQQLNDLGGAIDHAVEERLKSERFKTELITNASHDLKTPLTSIINYVDLLKKENIQDPKVLEYVEVLDRKSQRLKKLTEDLMEAAKASSGVLAVNRERLNLAQLAEQAAGEYEERLSAAGLTLVTALPEEEMTISADGRHVWRVLDNLLGNCAKYALEGSRVYLDVAAWDGNAVLTLKNISRQPLNIPVEQLLERFVRGDESRSTEGFGLGLSIARSLTELQGGMFSLSIDGDLFKATVRFPLIRGIPQRPSDARPAPWPAEYGETAEETAFPSDRQI